MDAIKYARKWLQPFMGTHPKEVQQIMGTLAFPSLATSPYQVLLSPYVTDRDDIYYYAIAYVSRGTMEGINRTISIGERAD